MGCILSFIRTFRSYHGAHLTPKQLARQRQQRANTAQSKQPRDPTPPSSPEEEIERRSLSLDAHGVPISYGSAGGQFTSFSTSSPPPATTPTYNTQNLPKKKAPKFSLMSGRLKGSSSKKNKGKR